jgi:hypothetical protein
MAYQEVSRVEIREVSRQGKYHVNGRRGQPEGDRTGTCLSQTTVRKYILAAEQGGLSRAGLSRPGNISPAEHEAPTYRLTHRPLTKL